MTALTLLRPFNVIRSVALLGLIFVFAACDSNTANDRCETFNTCDATDQLDVSLIESRTRMPANVSILFIRSMLRLV